MANSTIRPQKRNSPYRQSIGRWGEDLALKFLEAKGCTLVARNVRTPYGEIDLIADKAGLRIFVEVKTRSTSNSGYPESAVTEQKQEHLIASIDEYLSGLDAPVEEWRVDVIAITGRPGCKDPEIIWFEDALG